jgi:glycosyltransferase involved in cell wall biosynthesis
MMPGAAENRRLRIAVLNRSFVATGGGAERYSIALVEQLAQRHEVHVFAQQIDHQWPGVHYHRLWTPLTKPRWINQLWYAVTSWWATRRGFDVVHSHENTWHGQIQTVHVLPVKYSLFLGRSGGRLALRWLKVLTSPRLLVYLWLEKMRYAQVGHRRVVVTSPSLRDIMLQSYPRTAPMLDVLAPGVNRVIGPASAQDRFAARALLRLPAHGSCVLFVANDYRKKGLEVLLQALALLPADIYLAVVGNPAHIPPFRQKAQASGLADRVYFLGALKDTEPAYVAADILAHPTLEDTFAMVVLEAMSHGLPVVVAPECYCGISGLLDDGVQALVLANPRSAGEVAERVHLALLDAGMKARLAQAGANFARTCLWSEIAQKQEKIYRASMADED